MNLFMHNSESQLKDNLQYWMSLEIQSNELNLMKQ